MEYSNVNRPSHHHLQRGPRGKTVKDEKFHLQPKGQLRIYKSKGSFCLFNDKLMFKMLHRQKMKLQSTRRMAGLFVT